MSSFHPLRHLREISELQANQRGEVELLYRRLGKAPPPGLGLSHTAPHAGRRKRSSKHRLKPGKLLSPLVQQFRNVTTKSGDSSKSSACLLKTQVSQVDTARAKSVPFWFLCVFRCCYRYRWAYSESKRLSGKRVFPHSQQGPLMHQPPSQLHLGASADSAALLPQGLVVLW